MATPIRIKNLFDLTPQLNWQGHLEAATFSTTHQGVSVSSGYVGDRTEKEQAADFTEKLDHPALVIKYWTNVDQSVLKAVAVFSKYRMPFKLEIESYPPVDPLINQKYMTVLSLDVQRVYAVLKQHPDEFPMIPAEQVRKILGPLRTQPYKNNFLDLRREINDRIENPQARGSY